MYLLKISKSFQSFSLLFLIAALFFIGFMANESIAADTPTKKEIADLEKQAKAQKEESKNLEKKAENLNKEVKAIRHKMINVAKEIQNKEEILSNLEVKLESLKKEQAEMANMLIENNKHIVELVSILQNLAIKPTETIVVQPLEPVDVVRSIMLMRDSIPFIESSADNIKEDLKKLSSLRAAIQSQYSRMALVTTNLNNEHDEIKELHQKRVLLKQETEEEGKKAAKKAKQLAEKADDLKDLLNILEAEKKKKQQKKLEKLAKLTKPKLNYKEDVVIKSFDDKIGFAKARGSLPSPVKGKIITVYGETTKTGSHARGITIKTRSKAQVIAPYDGTVLFAGSFRGYGKLLIIEHGGGYHTLIAGLDIINVTVNQSLLAGEPVGLMAKDKEPMLYLELRKDGHPVNPKPWLASNNNDGISG